MVVFAVFAEALAMIGRKYDKGSMYNPAVCQVREEIAENPIHVSQFRTVTPLAAAQSRITWKIIRRVQVIKMKEQKEWRTAILIQPAHRCRSYLSCRPLEIADVNGGLIVKLERAVVNIESAAQSETAVQHESSDECSRPVSGTLQDSGQSRPGPEGDAVVFYAIFERIGGGEQRRMRRKRQWNKGTHLGEKRAAFRKGIDVRCDLSARLIATQVIRA